MATGTVYERVLCVYSVPSSLRPAPKQATCTIRSADEKSEAQRSDGHRHLEGMELGFTAGLEGRQPWARWGTITLQVQALEGGRAPGKPGKGVFQHAGGPRGSWERPPTGWKQARGRSLPA